MGYRMIIPLLKWTEIVRETSGVCSPSPISHPRLCKIGNKDKNHLIPFLIQELSYQFREQDIFLSLDLANMSSTIESSDWIFAFKQSVSPLLHFHQFSAPFSNRDKNTKFRTLTILLLPLPLPLPVPLPLLVLLLLAVAMMIIIIIMWFKRPIQVWWARCGARWVVRPQKCGSHLVWVRCAGTEHVPCSGNHRGLC